MPAVSRLSNEHTPEAREFQGAEWPATFAALKSRLSATGFPAFFRNKSGAATCSSALTTDPTQRLAVMRLCEREILIAEIRHRQRQHKATCSARAKLRRLTAELVA